MGSMSIWHWVIVLVVVVLLFGTKKLGNVGSDIGKAVKGFKDGVKGDEDKTVVTPEATVHTTHQTQQVGDKTTTIDVETREKHRS